MNRIKRYYSALSRYHKSNGFGIHSPFAFYFVLRVLRERSPYYAYQDITELRKTVIAKTIRYGRHPRIISLKNAKLIFRVVNHFNPQHILQIGTSYGISSACILKVSTKSDLVLYEPNLNDYDITNIILSSFSDRIKDFNKISDAINRYRKNNNENGAFILINGINANDYNKLKPYLSSVLSSNGVIILRNLSRSEQMRILWKECKLMTRSGMTFSNEKLAIIVIHSKLPRQDFSLWF